MLIKNASLPINDYFTQSLFLLVKSIQKNHFDSLRILWLKDVWILNNSKDQNLYKPMKHLLHN